MVAEHLSSCSMNNGPAFLAGPCTCGVDQSPLIVEFTSGGQRVGSNRPLSIPATFDCESRLFIFNDPALGIDAYSVQYDALRDVVLEELDVVWRNYAMAPASELAPDALLLKKALLTRFQVIEE